MDKRYQVFVSSTYADLKEERRSVIQTLMEMDCIPSGMELFPAADEEQWQFIMRIIDDCDYYLLIIGGRYGSTDSEGISYTEKEYDYAKSIGLQVLAFIHDTPEEIPAGKSELDSVARARLKSFRERVGASRLVKFWNVPSELPGLVALSLTKAMKTHPAVGWVRADKVASNEMVEQVNDLLRENATLRKEVERISETSQLVHVDNLASLDDTMKVNGSTFSARYKTRSQISTEVSWRQIFAGIAPHLLSHPSDAVVDGLAAKVAFPNHNSPSLDDQDFQTIKIQLMALGLVEIREVSATRAGGLLHWFLTPAGHRLMMQLRAVTAESGSAE